MWVAGSDDTMGYWTSLYLPQKGSKGLTLTCTLSRPASHKGQASLTPSFLPWIVSHGLTPRSPLVALPPLNYVPQSGDKRLPLVLRVWAENQRQGWEILREGELRGGSRPKGF